MSEDIIPILRIFFSLTTPFAFIGTMMSDLFRCAAPSPVFASRHIQSACNEIVIHILLPLIT